MPPRFGIALRRPHRPRALTALASVQRLEPRTLLAGNVVISEFLALNNTGLADADGDRSDWVELHNPTGADINLGGYALTDDRADLTQWRFPAVDLPGGGYLVVFASGKDRRTAGQELHTSFSLDGGGEDLLLVGPGGTADDVLSGYAPYPAQLPDVAFGTALSETITTLVGPSAPLRVRIPSGPDDGAGWTAREFDDTGWTAGRTGVGYDTVVPEPTVSGYVLKMVDVAPGGVDAVIDNLNEAATLLDGTFDPARYAIGFNGQAADPQPVINHGGGGRFGSDRVLPNGFGPANPDTVEERQQYALRATTNLVIPAGDWTINVNSDDGFRLRIPGVTFLTRTNENTSGLGASPQDTLVFGPGRGAGDTFATFTVPDGGLRSSLRLDFYEMTGGDSLELSVASGHQAAFSTGTFALLADRLQGWRVTTSAPPPPDYRPLLGADVRTAMHGVNATAYVRVPFSVDESDGFDTLRLRMKYDDGFVAYLNGTEVARRNAPTAPAWNSAAAASRADAAALAFEEMNLSLSALRDGENVLAIHGLNDAAGGDDFLVLPELQGVVSVQNAERYLKPPTPGQRNRTSDIAEVVADTRFSHDRGFYDAPFNVTIATATPGATIRYTTDGSPPTATTGTVYTGPVNVSTTTVLRAAAFKPGAFASNVDTQTYLFPAHVIHQPAAPAGFPAPGTPGMHWSYAMSPQVVDNPAYSASIVNDLKSIPSLSLVMKQADLFGTSGIYMNPGNSGLAWERPGSAELIHPDGTKEGFQIDAGVRIYGGVSRSTNYPKHTFRLLFKEQYGASKLKYPLFEGMPGAEGAADEFDTIILRGNFNKSWPFGDSNQRNMAQYLHDQFSATTQLAMGHPSIHGTFVHLYVNGLYWGLYNPVERPSAPFAASYLGGEKEDYDALNSSEPVDGTKDAWNALHAIANGIVPGGPWTAANPDPNALATPEAYARIKEYLDVENLVDYFILNIFGGNHDWDDHNWYAARERAPGAGYKFFSWDAERTLEQLSNDRSRVNQADKPSRLYHQLRANPEFRILFADRIHKHLFNDGALTPAKNRERYSALAAVIDRAVVGESARWGTFKQRSATDPRIGLPYERDVEWVRERDRILNEYFPQRNSWVVNQFKEIGLYPSVSAPAFGRHGGEVDEGFSLTISNPNAGGAGTIYYTLDGSDPRAPGGAVAPGAVAYTGPATLTRNTVAKARVLLNGTWSALNEATFSFNMAALRVTEVMYHPAPPPAGSTFTASDFEFLEVMNTGPRPLFVGGVGLEEAVDFTFGDLTLQPGQRAVVVANPAAFQSRYDTTDITIAGTFANSLSDGGERVRLEGPRGQTILDFSYEDDWYPQTDGDGYSLVAINPSGLPPAFDLKQSWRPSNKLHGGPGAADPGVNPGAVIVNEVLAAAATPAGDFVELHNTTDAQLDLSGWYISDAPANLRRYRAPAGTVVPAHGYLLISGLDLGFDLPDTGGQVILSSDDGDNVGGYRESARFGAAVPGVGFGQHVKTTGGTDFVALAAPTPGGSNSPPLVGPVVISEIMYNPPAGGSEYVELRNLTGDAVPLYDPADPARRWKFVDGIDYVLPAGATIPAFGYGLVVAVDPALFRTQRNVPPGVPVWGPYAGTGTNVLDNAGENLTLFRPGPGSSFMLADRLNYLDSAPWPTAPDGAGPSLARKDAAAYGNDFSNWAAEGTAGAALGGSPGRLNFDAAGPVADLLDVVPDPRFAPVDSVSIIFNEPVTGLTRAHLRLTRDGGANLLTPAQTLTSEDGITWTLANLAGITASAGAYAVTLDPSAGPIADYAGHALTAGASDTWQRAGGPLVMGRHVFYNNSAADRRAAAAGAGAGAGAGVGASIAPNKLALLPSGAAAFANVTSYARGLNGVMIDLAGLPAGFDPAAEDFVFRVGRGGDPSTWAAAPAPATSTRRNGAGTSGSDRLTLTWADGAIQNTWLQVTVLATARTGLSAPDVFYFGNLIGETGQGSTLLRVDALDVVATRARMRSTAPLSSAYDFNRDGRIDVLDLAAVRSNVLTSLQPPAFPPPQPAARPAAPFGSVAVPATAVVRSAPPKRSTAWLAAESTAAD